MGPQPHTYKMGPGALFLAGAALAFPQTPYGPALQDTPRPPEGESCAVPRAPTRPRYRISAPAPPVPPRAPQGAWCIWGRLPWRSPTPPTGPPYSLRARATGLGPLLGAFFGPGGPVYALKGSRAIPPWGVWGVKNDPFRGPEFPPGGVWGGHAPGGDAGLWVPQDPPFVVFRPTRRFGTIWGPTVWTEQAVNGEGPQARNSPTPRPAPPGGLLGGPVARARNLALKRLTAPYAPRPLGGSWGDRRRGRRYPVARARRGARNCAALPPRGRGGVL
eukprot:gene22506-biopygen20746